MSDPLKKFSDSTFPGGAGRLNSTLGGAATHVIVSNSDPSRPLPLLRAIMDLLSAAISP